MSGKPAYEIWCDGSYRGSQKNRGGPIGGGCVIHDTVTGREYSFSHLFNSLGNSRRQGSMIAEIRAVSKALLNAPKSEYIKVYNDNRGVVTALQNGVLSERTREKGGSELYSAFNHALMATQRHGHVSFEQRGRNTVMMRKAHNLAKSATEPPKANAA
jgi:ribonuclease HI